MTKKFAIVDLFAGPGGLAEGFASIRDGRGRRPFGIALSVEKDPAAHQTLLLRAFLRRFEGGFPREYYQFLNGNLDDPDWAALYPAEWKAACDEALLLELGTPQAWNILEGRFGEIQRSHGGNIILIGGPPCQAYSLVGRARNKGVKGYEASKDHRHFLYREYIRILDRLKPVAFVMENVKGMLSSSVDGERVFDQVLDDLSDVGQGAYSLFPLRPRSRIAARIGVKHPPATDFVVRAEDLGIPQARHRVIVVGIRSDAVGRIDAHALASGLLEQSDDTVCVRDVLSGMPPLRSGLSDREDSEDAWLAEMKTVVRRVAGMKSQVPAEMRERYGKLAAAVLRRLGSSGKRLRRSTGIVNAMPKSCPAALRRWLFDSRLKKYPNHDTRGHMASDLKRYFFASLYAAASGTSPKASVFPAALAPEHRNWKTGKFADRFRVQLWGSPATTVTSHISKDGHYFIHPDPAQCRSLTVREAARLQTFPDNYFFKGNRTQQYVQVGNAVPPFLARKIAEALHGVLVRSANRVEDNPQLKKSIVTETKKASR